MNASELYCYDSSVIMFKMAGIDKEVDNFRLFADGGSRRNIVFFEFPNVIIVSRIL